MRSFAEAPRLHSLMLFVKIFLSHISLLPRALDGFGTVALLAEK